MVATSGYTGGITPALEKKIVPIGSYIIVTEVLPGAVAQELSPRNRMIYDSKNYLYYYRLTPDRRMLFGGRAAFFPETADTIRKRVCSPTEEHARSEEHTSELQSHSDLVCRILLEKKTVVTNVIKA